jgi:hypothetical protein
MGSKFKVIDLLEFKIIEPTPSKRPSKTVEIESYWEAIKPNPDLLIEPEVVPRKYKKGCPLDRALVVIHEGRADVLEHIGSGLDYLSNECMLSDEVGSLCEGLASGVYILDGHMVTTGPSYYGDYDCYFEGDFRPATKKEWAAYLDAEYLWDESLWYESEIIVDAE